MCTQNPQKEGTAWWVSIVCIACGCVNMLILCWECGPAAACAATNLGLCFLCFYGNRTKEKQQMQFYRKIK